MPRAYEYLPWCKKHLHGGGVLLTCRLVDSSSMSNACILACSFKSLAVNVLLNNMFFSTTALKVFIHGS